MHILMSKRKNQGSQQVKRLQEEHGGKAVAEAVGVQAPIISKLATGYQTPSLDLAYRLEKTFGVPMSSWMTVAPCPR